MRLVVRQSDGHVRELTFDKGPVYIGRQMGSTLVIQDLQASRQHAVLFINQDGHWILEDLDSTNKTYLNDTAIHKSHVKDGDTIRIAGTTIEVHLESAPTETESPVETTGSPAAEPAPSGEPAAEDAVESPSAEEPAAEAAEPVIEVAEEPSAVHMQDTMVDVHHDIVTIHRTLDAKKGEPIQMPARRFGDLDRAAASFCRVRDLRQLHRAILEMMVRQLHAYHAWAAIRKGPDEPMAVEGGRDMATVAVKRQDLVLQQAVAEALDKGTYQLIPQLPRQISRGKVRSVIVAPVLRENGCFGVLYAENSTDHEHYTREDLDYLILLSILVAAVVEKA